MEQAAIVIVIGWFVVNWFSGRRNIKSKRRDMVTDHLIEAYRFLSVDISNRASLSDSTWRRFEEVVSDLQLFGDKELIALTVALTESITKGDNFSLNEIIERLRVELRKELKLKSVSGSVQWIRRGKDAEVA